MIRQIRGFSNGFPCGQEEDQEVVRGFATGIFRWLQGGGRGGLCLEMLSRQGSGEVRSSGKVVGGVGWGLKQAEG
jgi:hypothetical protein